MSVIKWLDEHLEEIFLVLCLVAITIVSFLQVVIRKIPFIPALTWAEEFCRFAWIWSVFISVPFTIKRCSMLRVTVLLDMMPEKVRKVFNIVVDVINLGAYAFLFYYAIPLVKDRFISAETSPAMLWPMWAMYLFIAIGFGLAIIRSIQVIIEHVKNFHEHQLTTLEQSIQDAKEEIAMAAAQEGFDVSEEGGNA